MVSQWGQLSRLSGFAFKVVWTSAKATKYEQSYAGWHCCQQFQPPKLRTSRGGFHLHSWTFVEYVSFTVLILVLLQILCSRFLSVIYMAKYWNSLLLYLKSICTFAWNVIQKSEWSVVFSIFWMCVIQPDHFYNSDLQRGWWVGKRS